MKINIMASIKALYNEITGVIRKKKGAAVRYKNPLLKKIRIMRSLRMRNSLKTVFWRSMMLSGLRMIVVSLIMVTEAQCCDRHI